MTRIAAILLGLAIAGCRTEPAPTTPARAELALLTSLPMVFGETFALEPPDSPLLTSLEERYTVRAIDGPEQLAKDGLLLAIQPQALTAERLVALDKWVRGGGRLVLLADPFLRFESERPLGDRFRPPLRYPDTGLLAHWGLALDDAVDTRAEAVETDLGRGIRVTAGGLGAITRRGGACTLSPTRLVARCRIGKGFATIVADADLAMSPQPDGHAAIVALVGELDR